MTTTHNMVTGRGSDGPYQDWITPCCTCGWKGTKYYSTGAMVTESTKAWVYHVEAAKLEEVRQLAKEWNLAHLIPKKEAI